MSLSEWLLAQLSDSSFPAGGFAHSGGLEAAWQCGQITSADSFYDYVKLAIDQGAHATLPFVMATHREPARFIEWDNYLDTVLSNHVANRGSRAQGQAFLRTAMSVFSEPGMNTQFMHLQTARGPTHFATVLGACCQILNVRDHSCARLYLFVMLRSLISAAVRLGIVGTHEGQNVQWKLGPYAEKWVIGAANLAPEDAGQTLPILDLLQGNQDRLYSRLFQS